MNADQVALLSAMVPLSAALLLLMHRWPKLAFATWLAAICFLPVWVGAAVGIGPFFPAFVFIGFLALASWLPRIADPKLTVIDMLFLLVLVLVIVEYALHMTTLSFTFTLVTWWAMPYALGRMVIKAVPAQWVIQALAVAFTVVGILALIEFATSVNLFIQMIPMGNDQFQVWGTLQPRGNVIRAEGAFGHSIALGTSLSIAAALTAGSSLRPWLKIVMITIMLGGVVVSFSRTAMVVGVLAILLVTIFQRYGLSARVRGMVLGTILLMVSVAEGLVTKVFAESTEAQGSATYRSDLLSLIGAMKPLGVSGSFEQSTSGATSIGDFGSIDNAALVFGLAYGWLPLALVGVSLLAAVVVTARGRATTPTITVVALIPAFVTVAFITQYSALVWFLIGFAVASQTSRLELSGFQDHKATALVRMADIP